MVGLEKLIKRSMGLQNREKALYEEIWLASKWAEKEQDYSSILNWMKTRDYLNREWK